jgi:ABC-type lipoprotein release transport system permease subunit
MAGDAASGPEGLSTSLLLRLAFRNVRKSVRRSLLTASAMVLGLALLILSRTLADGAHETWIDQGVRLGSGHVAVQGAGFQQTGSLSDMLSAVDLARAVEAADVPQVATHLTSAAPRLAVQGLASSAGSSAPVLLVGVDPAREPEFSLLDDNLVEGRYLEPDDRLAAFVGQGLVDRLGLRLGSRFVVTAADADGEIQGQLLRIRGIYRTGVPDLDQSLVHMPLATAQEWLGAGGGVTGLAFLLDTSRETPRVVRSLSRSLGDAPVDVLSWRDLSPELDAAVKIDDLGDWVFHLITLAIIALAILNAILMSVLHRQREFGVLRALGLTARETGRVVMAEGIMLSLVSGILGVLIGLAIVFGFWRDGLDLSFMMDEELTFGGTLFDPVMIPAFRPSQIGLSLFFILLIGITASLYPAHQATKIDVAEAMKFER